MGGESQTKGRNLGAEKMHVRVSQVRRAGEQPRAKKSQISCHRPTHFPFVMCLPPVKTTNPIPASPTRGKSLPSNADSPPRKWYNQGGIQGITEIGMGINVLATPIFFLHQISADDFFMAYSFQQVFGAVLLFQMTTAVILHGMRTLFCIVCVSMYLTSLLIVPTLNVRPEVLLLVSLGLAAWRVCICMSVCLHRYSAHAAFKCSTPMQLFLNLLGCAANQGGPIWWASQHRCHHKYCELERDPHSALQVGTERAFVFFLEKRIVEEEFAPRHNDNWYLRLVDTWSFLVPLLETVGAYFLFGKEGLFVSYTSLWLCECITLWFNIANHPAHAKGEVCKASSVRGWPKEWYPAFQMLNILHPFLGYFAGEIGHDDHHDHPMLAKRDEVDLGYFLFILPLAKLGLVWDVKTKRHF